MTATELGTIEGVLDMSGGSVSGLLVEGYLAKKPTNAMPVAEVGGVS